MPVSHSSRILCLVLQVRESKARLKNVAALCEAFLRFSPRVQVRKQAEQATAQSETNTFFLDIASTAHLFGGEEKLLQQILEFTENLGFSIQAAISDTPSGANVLACSSESHHICHSGEERETLQHLSLPFLLHFQGVCAWEKPQVVRQMVSYFYMLGFNCLGDLKDFSFLSFRERWGETGATVWRRLHGTECQVISPFEATELLQEYVYLDFPISLVSLLLHQVRCTTEFLFARLQGRRLYAQKLILTLRCEYSSASYKIEIEPNTPSRNLDLYLTLLERKLGEIDLENPIRDFEIETVPCPERTRQLDFFAPRTTDNDRLENLLSLLRQSDIQTGLFQLRESILPEGSWQLTNLYEKQEGSIRQTAAQQAAVAILGMQNSFDVGEHTTDMPHRQLQPSVKSVNRSENRPKNSPARLLSSKANNQINNYPNRKPATGKSPAKAENGIHQVQALPVYCKDLSLAPRPTRLLRQARKISGRELRDLHLLSRNPLERLESAWWSSDGHNHVERDYYFATNKEGQSLWIYKDLKQSGYYLHGYFD